MLIESSLAGQADRMLCNPGRAQIHCSIAAGGRQLGNIRLHTAPLMLSDYVKQFKAPKATANCCLNQLDNSHFSVVTLPRHGTQDTAVATLTITVAFRGVFEKKVHQLLVIDVAHCLRKMNKLSRLERINGLRNRLGAFRVLCVLSGLTWRLEWREPSLLS